MDSASISAGVDLLLDSIDVVSEAYYRMRGTLFLVGSTPVASEGFSKIISRNADLTT